MHFVTTGRCTRGSCTASGPGSLGVTCPQSSGHGKGTGGSGESQENAMGLPTEPPDHAIGRSRGGLSTKIHHLCDGRGRPLVLPGRDPRAGRSISPMFSSVCLLRSRGIAAVIAEPSDQAGHRRRRGSAGGRPPAFDAEAYQGRNVIERLFNVLKQWRGLAIRYDKLALTDRRGVVLGAIITWLRALRVAP